jgi:hypothetical protein
VCSTLDKPCAVMVPPQNREALARDTMIEMLTRFQPRSLCLCGNRRIPHIRQPLARRHRLGFGLDDGAELLPV